MATTVNLGPYRIRPCGEYESDRSYRFLDLISYQGSSYICKNMDMIDKTACIGIPPVGAPSSTMYWQCVAEKGEDGVIMTEYLPIEHLEDDTWDFDVTDKIYVPANFTRQLQIINVKEGECGIILTKNRSLILPDNSDYSTDFNYVTITNANQYYMYSFVYADVGAGPKFMWNRTVMNQ